MKTPSSLPSTLPRPPVSMVPPMTTAVIDPRLNPPSATGAEATDQEDCGDGRQETHQTVSEQDHACGWQSRHRGGAWIAAKGVDLPSESRIGENEADNGE